MSRVHGSQLSLTEYVVPEVAFLKTGHPQSDLYSLFG